MSIATATQLQYEQLRDAAAVVDTFSQELSQGTRRHAAPWFATAGLALAELDTILGAIYDSPVGGDGTVLEATSLQLEALRDTSRRVALGVQGFAQGDRRRFVPEYLSALDNTCMECYQAVRDIRGEPEPEVEGITIDGGDFSSDIGDTVQLGVTASLDDGTQRPVTSGVEWTSSSANVTVDTSGRATAVTPGDATITAQFEGFSDSVVATVNEAVVTGITISPATVNLDVGDTQQLSVQAQYSDGSTDSIPGGDVSWSSDNSGVVSVSASGLVTGVAGGSAGITGSYEGHTDASDVTVNEPEPEPEPEVVGGD